MRFFSLSLSSLIINVSRTERRHIKKGYIEKVPLHFFTLFQRETFPLTCQSFLRTHTQYQLSFPLFFSSNPFACVKTLFFFFGSPTPLSLSLLFFFHLLYIFLHVGRFCLHNPDPPPSFCYLPEGAQRSSPERIFDFRLISNRVAESYEERDTVCWFFSLCLSFLLLFSIFRHSLHLVYFRNYIAQGQFVRALFFLDLYTQFFLDYSCLR